MATIRQRLEEAWEISALPGTSRVVAAHDFVCHRHAVPSDCSPKRACTGAVDRENMAMLDVADDLRDASPHADVEDLVRLWATRLVGA